MFFKKKPHITILKEIEGDQSSVKIQSLINGGYHLIEKLHKECNAQFTVVNKDDMVITINGVKFYIECTEDLFIVNEVFNEKTYGFEGSDEYILIDIGANIGTSSLYFSNSSQIKSIYSFEPVEETYKKCLINIGLNPFVTNIKVFNIGLGNSNRTDEFIYSEDYKGSVGVLELAEFKVNNSAELKRVNVKIEKAGDALKKIITTDIDKKVMVKIDCEGGEYEIIPDLKECGLLDKIDIIMMEWHNNDLDKLLPYFTSFNCFYYKNSDTTGMLYASNKNG